MSRGKHGQRSERNRDIDSKDTTIQIQERTVKALQKDLNDARAESAQEIKILTERISRLSSQVAAGSSDTVLEREKTIAELKDELGQANTVIVGQQEHWLKAWNGMTDHFAALGMDTAESMEALFVVLGENPVKVVANLTPTFKRMSERSRQMLETAKRFNSNRGSRLQQAQKRHDAALTQEAYDDSSSS